MSIFCQSGQHRFELKGATPLSGVFTVFVQEASEQVLTQEYGLRMQEYSLRLRRCYGVVVDSLSVCAEPRPPEAMFAR